MGGSIHDITNQYLQDSNHNNQKQETEFGDVPVSNDFFFGEMYAVDENGNRIAEFEFGKKTIFPPCSLTYSRPK